MKDKLKGYDKKKWIYLEDRKGLFIGKIFESPRVIYEIVKSNGVKVVSTRQKSDYSECWRLYPVSIGE